MGEVSPERDPEHEAFKQLETAIANYLEASGIEGIVTDWVLVTSSVIPGMPDEGDRVQTQYSASNYQPAYRTLGLLGHADTLVRAEISDLLT